MNCILRNLEIDVMNNKTQSFERGAGILLPISSIPSKYGIGTFGREAYRFVDALVDAQQTYWQVLPVGPTSFGDSPYQSFSAFAGNPYFIDLEYLVQEGLLTVEDIESKEWGDDPADIAYATIFNNRFDVLRIAYKNSKHKDTDDYKEFCENNTYWLNDYSFYMALKNKFDNHSWTEWDDDIKFREDAAVKKYQKE